MPRLSRNFLTTEDTEDTEVHVITFVESPLCLCNKIVRSLFTQPKYTNISIYQYTTVLMKNTLFFALLLVLSSCKSFVSVQSKELYDVVEVEDSQDINGFKELVIFSDNFDNTIWVSPEKHCVTLAKETDHKFAGTHSIHLKWDKVTGGCKWIGVGFGWNDWIAKDMIDVVDEAAIQFQVRAVKGSFSNLPVAFAIEDYTGVQSYFGYNSSLNTGKFNDQGWTTVTIPLNKFPFQRNDADLGKVKQFMIQLEGDGDIYLDEIKIVKI
jgi:Surface glycan-binding protein B xyloglucan binding domain